MARRGEARRNQQEEAPAKVGAFFMKQARQGLPHEPPLYTPRIVYAVRAFAEGRADEAQQKLLWEWITMKVCGYPDLSYQPSDRGGALATAFAEGKRFVGSMILRLREPEFTPSPEDNQPDPKRVNKTVNIRRKGAR